MEKWTHVAQMAHFFRESLPYPLPPTAAIIERWGFRDAATFSRTFKRIAGPPPKRVSSTARFTLGDGFGQAYAVKRREIVITRDRA